MTKLRGENIVKKICSNYIIARTSVIYGANKNNFVTWIISNLKNNKKISIVNDQFNSPTYNINISEQLITLIENDLKGVFHTASSERINRYDFALKIADIFDYNTNLIKPTKMDNMSWIAKRPKDTSLCTSKIANFIKTYKVTEALELLRKEMGF